MPILSVVAGPNGSGKSTLTEWVALEGKGLLLDPDAVARELCREDPASAAIAAGREVLRRIDEFFFRQVSFAVETTLSSKNSIDLIERARIAGYEVHLTYVALESPERCILRIWNRVLDGGHSIPEADVRRRYERSLANLPKALARADIATVYDNSGPEHRLLFKARSGVLTWRAADIPLWARVISEV